MAIQPTFPGVYVQEAPSGVHTIAEVATSVAAFVGMTPSGPVNVPAMVFSYREFDRIFGGDVYVGELPDQVRQFFLNGGGQAWIVRNALNALDGANMVARSELLNETNTGPGVPAPVLVVEARNAGSAGNTLQLQVDYETASPERTFNLSVYLPIVKSDGSAGVQLAEKFKELTLDPDSPNFAPRIVNRDSERIRAIVQAGLVPSGENHSQSGLIIDDLALFVATNLGGGSQRLIMVSVANRPPALVDLQGLPAVNIPTEIAKKINDALHLAGETTNVTVSFAQVGTTATTGALRISSADGAVVVTSAASPNDVAKLLQFGVANGGIEIDGWSAMRPAASSFLTRVHTGTILKRLHDFAAAKKSDIGDWTIAAAPTRGGTGQVPSFAVADLISDDPDNTLANVVGTFKGVAKSFEAIADAINSSPTNNIPDDFEVYSTGTRIGLRPKYGGLNSDLALGLESAGPTYQMQGGGNLAQTGIEPTNVVRYGLGLPTPVIPPGPGGGYRNLLQAGNDGDVPLPQDYEYSWDKLERTADVFNIMVLPRAESAVARQTDADRQAVWPSASQFCRRMRAFLLVDPPMENYPAPWVNVSAAVGDIANFRGPLDQDYAAVYWPRVVANNAAGKKITLDPSGTIAGLYAKTDTRRGVWKAPAGLEATLTGVTGLELLVTNDENGRTNPQAINTLRMKVSGVTSWGARTLLGFEGAADQDYRYVPVRRVALHIEESLYRGLQFAVFEPNDEPLWGQIRLAAGSFMNGLFRKGAFKGLKASEAYYVACGKSTTTQRDINLGIVNVEVGFAPLKPAEFVVITIKQLAGQIEV
jgi:uncharacterized protein